jgi:hypothetical protein
MVKKIFFLAAAILVFISCSGNSTEPEEKKVSFSPPAWIIGKWSDAYKINMFTFTSDDIVLTIPDTAPFSFKSIPNTSTVTESAVNEAEYQINIKLPTDEQITYRFVKQTNLQLLYFFIINDEDAGGGLELVKQ